MGENEQARYAHFRCVDRREEVLQENNGHNTLDFTDDLRLWVPQGQVPLRSRFRRTNFVVGRALDCYKLLSIERTLVRDELLSMEGTPVRSEVTKVAIHLQQVMPESEEQGFLARSLSKFRE